jgi:uncharacterized damage-inducible protein DinB
MTIRKVEIARKRTFPKNSDEMTTNERYTTDINPEQKNGVTTTQDVLTHHTT